MSITESLGMEHIMVTPERARVMLGLPPALPEKKKWGPKPGSKYKNRADDTTNNNGAPGPKSVSGNSCHSTVDVPNLVEVADPYARLNRMVDVLVAEYQHQQELRDAAQARMTYLDGLYNQMTNGELYLSQNGASL